MQNKNIIVTKHAIRRARSRLGLNYKAVRRMFISALDTKQTVHNANNNTKAICKNNINFIFKEYENELRIITITNLNDIQAYKESQTIPIYIKGTKTKHTMRVKG